jgi:hypothetical protein
MSPRLPLTLIMVLLALTAFLQISHDPPRLIQDAGYFAFGILFIVIAAIIWFKWESIRAGFYAANDEPQRPILWRIGGMASLLRHGPRQRRSPPASD